MLWKEIRGPRQAEELLKGFDHRRSQVYMSFCNIWLSFWHDFSRGSVPYLWGHLHTLGIEDNAVCIFFRAKVKTSKYLFDAVVRLKCRKLSSLNNFTRKQYPSWRIFKLLEFWDGKIKTRVQEDVWLTCICWLDVTQFTMCFKKHTRRFRRETFFRSKKAYLFRFYLS